MIPVNIQAGEYLVRNISAIDIQEVLNCINQEEENCRTLGRDDYMDYSELEQRYLESLMNSLEYFCGIYFKDKLIGIIKGRIENKTENELWILSYLFLKEYRGIGIGSKVLKAVEEHFSQSYSVCKFGIIILNDNKRGLNFWIRNNYMITRKANSMSKGPIKSNEMIILDKQFR